MTLSVVALSILVALVASKIITTEDEINLQDKAFGYITKVAQPLANRIRNAERLSATLRKMLDPSPNSLKISDGTAARLGLIPYQAGIIIHYHSNEGVCGGTLISSTRVLTAAHCWWDGKNQAHTFTVVLGSENLYSGGIRMDTSKVIIHSKWNPRKMHYDIAMVYLPSAVKFSDTIKPIALPFGRYLSDDFVGKSVLASGYGDTRYGNNELLFYVKLKVISNEDCSPYYKKNIRSTEMCAWSPEQRASNICNGDSGGPLVLLQNKKLILVGITSYGAKNCTKGTPSGYTRVTSYIKWIRRHL